jgi:hypothetical protein
VSEAEARMRGHDAFDLIEEQFNLHAARLLREPERYITRFGKQNYDIKPGDCLWHVYRMIGKLSSRVYLLSAPNDFGMPGPTAGSAEPGG